MNTQASTEKVYRYENDFMEFVERVKSREVLRIDREMFDYWLGVLPPVYMNKRQVIEIEGKKTRMVCSFGFVEGYDYITDFWTSNNSYFCKMSDRVNWGG